MKTFFSLFASFLLFTAHASALTADGGVHARDIEARADENCPPPYQAVNFLRAFLPADDHFYTADEAEMQNAVQNLGYRSEGTAAKVFLSQQPPTVPLFRLNRRDSAGSDHFYTTSESERDTAIQNLGYSSEGTAAFVYPTQVCGSIPLFRSFNPTIVDHFYTTSEQEKDSAQAAGWSFEGISAYVLPA